MVTTISDKDFVNKNFYFYFSDRVCWINWFDFVLPLPINKRNVSFTFTTFEQNSQLYRQRNCQRKLTVIRPNWLWKHRLPKNTLENISVNISTYSTNHGYRLYFQRCSYTQTRKYRYVTQISNLQHFTYVCHHKSGTIHTHSDLGEVLIVETMQ